MKSAPRGTVIVMSTPMAVTVELDQSITIQGIDGTAAGRGQTIDAAMRDFVQKNPNRIATTSNVAE